MNTLQKNEHTTTRGHGLQNPSHHQSSAVTDNFMDTPIPPLRRKFMNETHPAIKKYFLNPTYHLKQEIHRMNNKHRQKKNL